MIEYEKYMTYLIEAILVLLVLLVIALSNTNNPKKNKPRFMVPHRIKKSFFKTLFENNPEIE